TSTAATAVIFESLTAGSEDFHLTDHANNLATSYGDSANAPAEDWEGDTRDVEATGFTSAGADEIGTTPPTNITVTPTPASATSSTVDPTVVAPDVTVVPSPADATSSTADPVVLFDVDVTPAAITATSSTVDPTVVVTTDQMDPVTGLAAADNNN